jgi:uncharacterized damage-inducible protein DinB
MTGSLLGDAFAHHIWATQRLIDECAALTPEQLAQPAAGTYGSIIDTLRHLVASDCWYLSFFAQGTASIAEDAETSLAELRVVVTENGAAWTQLLSGAVDADTEMVEDDDGLMVLSPVGVRLAQVIHHGTDHRSQICTALTSLGFEPPDVDVWAYARAAGRERVVDRPPL